MLKTREEAKIAYIKHAQKLSARKEKLFKEDDITKWEIISKESFNKQELMKNKAEAFKIMCTKVSFLRTES